MELSPEQGPKAAEIGQQMARQVDRTAASHPGAQKNGEELGV
ncbi:hypothetical protein ppKF707_5318 [Metapseudomonas furukawaii]|nr:hypothetical protein ppKF707_5318 [Pseudomonas furukawaii]